MKPCVDSTSESLNKRLDGGNMSDDSEEEPCAICLGHMRGDIGSPEGCDHNFCLECILEWSKVSYIMR